MGLGMVVEADGGILLTAGLLGCFTKRTQTGFCSADGGQHTQNGEDHYDPNSQIEFLLKPNLVGMTVACAVAIEEAMKA